MKKTKIGQYPQYYKIIFGATPDVLECLVNREISQGYMPIGGVVIYPSRYEQWAEFRYAQNMVKMDAFAKVALNTVYGKYASQKAK